MIWSELLFNPVFGIFVFLSAAIIVAMINSQALTRLEGNSVNPDLNTGQPASRISVLVPARNEEKKIEACIRSLLRQHHPNFEVLALDDNSSDRTGEILARLADENERLRVVAGKPLPEGWLGKNWACHQLSQHASGELFLFVDADTYHHPETLSRAAAALEREKLAMLTALPRQEVASLGEKLTVPILYWSMMCFIPLPLAYRLRLPTLSTAIGQFMLFQRQAYWQIGGHGAVRGHAADDLELVRQVKIHSLPWRLADGSKLVQTRMYHSFGEAYEGLSKNLFAAFNYHVLPFIFAWLWCGYIFYRPLVELAAPLFGYQTEAVTLMFSWLSILAALVLWGTVTWRLSFPRYLFLAYPAIIFLGVWIAMRSLGLSLLGRSSWKGRLLTKPKIRLV